MLPSRHNAESGGLAAVWQRRGPLACLLFPLSLLFRLMVALRRMLYRYGMLHAAAMPVPVVVVGNITVGGSGKTPLVLHLALRLHALGRNPGIVSRGYRRKRAEVAEVTPDSDPSIVGDEPLLLARRAGCPVFVGRDRPAAVRALLAAHPGCDLILADDGLQHYQLQRDIEIAVFDQRGVMNGWCLPAGPLREPLARLAQVAAVVLNGSTVACPQSEDPGAQSASAPTLVRPRFAMRMLGERFYLLNDPQSICGPADLAGQSLHAVAGIGFPQRFFDRLSAMGLSFAGHPFADHHDFCAADVAFPGDAILTTEKDAVKLARLSLSLPVWVLPVTAEISPDLAAFVLEKLNGPTPA